MGIGNSATKKMTRLFALSIILATALIIYVLWGEYSRLSVEKQQSVDARLSELSRKLSVPVKVFDFASIHESIMGSTLIDLTDTVEVIGLDGKSLYTNNSSPMKCHGSEAFKDVYYQNYLAGRLRVCLKKSKFSGSGFFFTVLIICSLAGMLIFYLFMGGMRLTSQLGRIENFVRGIDPKKPLDIPAIDIGDGELAPIYESIMSLLSQIHAGNKEIAGLKTHEEVSKKVRRVAHDIRSPLSAMKAIMLYENNLMEGSKELLNDSINSIGRISEEILEKYKDDETSDLNDQDLSLRSLWMRKKIEHLSKGIAFQDNIQWDEVDKIKEPTKFRSTLSNIINNAVEAIGDKQGRVLLESQKMGDKIVVKVTDNGPGINEKLKKVLGQKEITTKKSGNGIGLLNAREYLESIKGALRIDSGQWGTSVFVEVLG